MTTFDVMDELMFRIHADVLNDGAASSTSTASRAGRRGRTRSGCSSAGIPS